MSTETWALLGVVVGAILGALAQLVADSLRRRHEKALVSRTDRREAYTEFLAGAQGLLKPAERGGRTTARAVLTDLHDALDRVNVARARVDLVAPEDTYEACDSVHSSLIVLILKDDEKEAPHVPELRAYVHARQEFLRLAKRDLT